MSRKILSELASHTAAKLKRFALDPITPYFATRVAHMTAARLSSASRASKCPVSKDSEHRRRLIPVPEWAKAFAPQNPAVPNEPGPPSGLFENTPAFCNAWLLVSLRTHCSA